MGKEVLIPCTVIFICIAPSVRGHLVCKCDLSVSSRESGCACRAVSLGHALMLCCSGAGGSGPEVCWVSAREPVTEPRSRMLEMEIVEQTWHSCVRITPQSLVKSLPLFLSHSAHVPKVLECILKGVCFFFFLLYFLLRDIQWWKRQHRSLKMSQCWSKS